MIIIIVKRKFQEFGYNCIMIFIDIFKNGTQKRKLKIVST